MAKAKVMLAEAAKIENRLSRLKGVKLKKARRRMYSLRSRARRMGMKRTKREVAPEQGILPGFLEQVQPRVDELARKIVFEALQKSLARAVEQAIPQLNGNKRKSS